MTIDERLEKLVERHEAMAQTVELMAAENRESFAKLIDSMEKLLRIAEAHERRLHRLESGRAG